MKNNIQYMEGGFTAERMVTKIETTTYGTIEQAYKIKDELVKNFEKEFGYSRQDKEPDSNYAYACGMRDKLAEIITKSNEGEQ